MRKLTVNDRTITDNGAIMNELQSFYQDLYMKKERYCTDLPKKKKKFFKDIPKLSEESKESCEGKLTISECFEVLKTLENNKTPGNDGLTAEFYKVFWPLVGKILVDCLNYSHEHGELSTTQKQAVITLIEKKDRDRSLIKNWRPISLINVDAKIGSKAIAYRLEKVLPSVIHHNQHAFVKNRTIFDAIRTIEDVLCFTKSKSIDAFLIAIDFEKAFDSVDRNFLFETLKEFNFGTSLLNWVKTFYHDISSCVMNNGHASPFFSIKRGVRQGDPISPYLFILVLETLANSIRKEPGIDGIRIKENIIKQVIFADDLTIFFRNKSSFHILQSLLSDFYFASGLKINDEKTEVLGLGSCVPLKDDFGVAEIKETIKILGIYFTYNNTNFKRFNFDSILDFIRCTFTRWKWRGLTIIGKIQIIKTFIIPKILHCTSAIAPDKEFIKEVNRVLYSFVWKGKDKVKRKVLIKDIADGGLRMPDIESIIQSQRVMCVKKFLDGSPCSWKEFLSFYLNNVGGKLLFKCNFDLSKLHLKFTNVL